MRDELRQATALLGAVLLGERGHGTVHDLAAGRRVSFDVSELEALAAGDRGFAHVVDRARHRSFMVDGRGPSYRVSDPTRGDLVALKLEDGGFRGHDSASGSFFDGRLDRHVVEILDHADGRVHRYQLTPGLGERRG